MISEYTPFLLALLFLGILALMLGISLSERKTKCSIERLDKCEPDQAVAICLNGDDTSGRCYEHCLRQGQSVTTFNDDQCVLQSMCMELVDETGKMHQEWARCDPCFYENTLDCVDPAMFCAIYGQEPMLPQTTQTCDGRVCSDDPLLANCDRENFCKGDNPDSICRDVCLASYLEDFDSFNSKYLGTRVHPCETEFCSRLESIISTTCQQCYGNWQGCDWDFFCSFPENEIMCQDRCINGTWDACQGKGRSWCSRFCEETGQNCETACIVGGDCFPRANNPCKISAFPNDRCYQLELQVNGTYHKLGYQPSYAPSSGEYSHLSNGLSKDVWQSMQIVRDPLLALTIDDGLQHNYFAIKYAGVLNERAVYLIIPYDHPYLALYADGLEGSDRTSACLVRELGFNYARPGGTVAVPATNFLFFIENVSAVTGNDNFVIMPAINSFYPIPTVLGTTLTVDINTGCAQFAVPTQFDTSTQLPVNTSVRINTSSALVFPCIGGSQQTSDTLGYMLGFNAINQGVEAEYSIMNIINSGDWNRTYIPMLDFQSDIRYLRSTKTKCRYASLNGIAAFSTRPAKTIVLQPGYELWLTVLASCTGNDRTSLSGISSTNVSSGNICAVTSNKSAVRYQCIVPYVFQKLFYAITMPDEMDSVFTTPRIIGQEKEFPRPQDYVDYDSTAYLMWRTVPPLWNSKRNGQSGIFFGEESIKAALLLAVLQPTDGGCEKREGCGFPANITPYPSDTSPSGSNHFGLSAGDLVC